MTVARPPSDDVPDALSVIMYAGECPPAAAAASTLLQSARSLRCWRSHRSPPCWDADQQAGLQVSPLTHSLTHPHPPPPAMSTPKLSPFVPIYKGLPGDALPPELATVTPEGEPDAVSLFWRARKLQALVFQVSTAGCIQHCWLHGGRLSLTAAARSHAFYLGARCCTLQATSALPALHHCRLTAPAHCLPLPTACTAGLAHPGPTRSRGHCGLGAAGGAAGAAPV